MDPSNEMPPVRRAQVRYAVLERDSEEKHMTPGPAAREMAWLEPWEHRVLGKQAHTFRRSMVGSCICVSIFIGKKQ